MSHLVPALLLFMFTPPPHPVSLPDAPTVQLKPQTLAPPAPALATPDPHWLKVEQLPPGKAIAVLEIGRTHPTSCSLELADDTTLACIQASSYYSPRRVVFPMHSVMAVFSEEVRSGPSRTALLLGLGIGAAMGAGVCNEGSARVILTCSLLGAGIGAGIAVSPSPIPRPPHISRRLIYRAP